MKHTLLLIGALAGTLVFASSCEEEGEAAPETTPIIADLNTIFSESEISKIIPTEEEEISFSYDEKGKMKGATAIWNNGKSVYYMVYDDSKLTTINIYSNGTETSNVDGQTSESQWEDSAQIVLSYNDQNLINKLSYYEFDEEGTDVEEFILSYNENNKLTKITEFYNQEMDDYSEFEWNGDNVSLEKYFNVDNNANARKKSNEPFHHKKSSLLKARLAGENTGTLSEETVLSEFDDKSNPLSILALLYGDFDGRFLSKNNYVKIEKKWLDEYGNIDISRLITTTYQYDSKGRPTKATSTTKEGEAQQQEIILFEYKN